MDFGVFVDEFLLCFLILPPLNTTPKIKNIVTTHSGTVSIPLAGGGGGKAGEMGEVNLLP